MNGVCQNYALISIMYIVDKALDIIQILGPILLIVALGIHLVRLVTNPDDKKNKSRIKNTLIALVMIFVVPVVVNATMNLLTEGYSVEGCFEIARNYENIFDPTTYTDIPNNERTPSSILIDPSEYDEATAQSLNGSDLLTVAERLWKQVYNGGFTYSSSSSKKIPITGNKIDCSAFVTWILYESGMTQFGGYQLKTKDFMEYDWEALGATVIDVKAGENVVNKLQPGDILVRTPVSNGKAGYGHVNITAYVSNGKVYAYDCGSTSNWTNSGGKAVDKTYFAKDSRPGKIIRFS